jgi:hypothetical protein
MSKHLLQVKDGAAASPWAMFSAMITADHALNREELDSLSAFMQERENVA